MLSKLSKELLDQEYKAFTEECLATKLTDGKAYDGDPLTKAEFLLIREMTEDLNGSRVVLEAICEARYQDEAQARRRTIEVMTIFGVIYYHWMLILHNSQYDAISVFREMCDEAEIFRARMNLKLKAKGLDRI